MRPLILSILVVAAGCSNQSEPMPSPEGAPSDASRVSCHVMADEFETVQDAVDSAIDGQTVCLGAGTYSGNLNLMDRNIRITGYGPSETILEGDGQSSVVWVHGSDLELAGLTIRGGMAVEGGGLYARASDVQLENIVVTDNMAERIGGGIYAERSVVMADDVTVLHNEAGLRGGGIGLGQGQLWGDDLTVHENMAHGNGGGIEAGRGGVWLTDSQITNNAALGFEAEGGGLYTHHVELSLQNVLVANNHADWRGGGFTVGGNDSEFTNVALLRNHAQTAAAAHFSGWGHTAYVTNSVIAYNMAEAAVGGVLTDRTTEVQYSYTNFWKNTAPQVAPREMELRGEHGNVAVDPMFVNIEGDVPSAWDLRLMPDSELVDAGDPSMMDWDGTVSDIGLHGGGYAR